MKKLKSDSSMMQQCCDGIKDLNGSSLSEQNYGLEYERMSNSNIIVTSPRYMSSFFKSLQTFQASDKFCDIVLKANNCSEIVAGSSRNQNNKIKAHKIVLACASPYFRAMLTSGYRDETFQEITLENISLEILSLIIEFIYKGKILVNENNVFDLLPASKMLQVDDIVNACCIYLHLNIDTNNCIGIEQFAKQFGCLDLAKYAQKFITEHFADVINSEEFLNLNEVQLCNLLHRDDLTVRCETIVFKAVVDWVRYSPEMRRAHLDFLFECVRCHYLPPRFLKDQMATCDVLKSNEARKSREFLQRILDDLIAHRPCPYKQRKPNIAFALYVIGGYQRQSTNLVECFRSSSSSWDRCADMKYPRSGIACISSAFYIYAIGGRNSTASGNHVDSAEVEIYDPFLNTWRTLKSMNVPRSRAAAGMIDGLIYVVGGANGTVHHQTVERYIPMENRWEYVESLAIPRLGLSCCVVNRFLYAIGGYDGSNRLNQVECYNPDENVWRFVSPMVVARSGAGACSLDNFIYVVGGYTTDVTLNSAERYDTLIDQWSFISNLLSARSALTCTMWDGKIYALGGYNGREFMSTIETYDPKENKWTKADNMTSERSGHGAAVTMEMP